jgi:predicted HNH restriction endonuclease
LTDLLLVCRGCHEFLHGLSAIDPKDWRQAQQEDFWRKGEAA